MGKLIIKINDKSHYPKDKDIECLTAYIDGRGRNKNHQKVIYTGANGVKRDCHEAARQFITVQRTLHKDSGRRAYHMIVSFEETFHKADIVIQASRAIGKEIFRRHQVFYSVHASTDNLHTHFAINAVSYVDGKKWHMSKPEFQEYKENLLERVNDVMQKNNMPPLTLSKN